MEWKGSNFPSSPQPLNLNSWDTTLLISNLEKGSPAPAPAPEIQAVCWEWGRGVAGERGLDSSGPGWGIMASLLWGEGPSSC